MFDSPIAAAFRKGDGFTFNPSEADRLVSAFRYWRAGLPKHSPYTAAAALAHARRDLAEGVRRYPASRDRLPAVHWIEAERPGQRLGVVERPEHAGLRLVGRVVPESRGHDWDRNGDTGWHTDPAGDVFKDGTGLAFGLVFQLPSRHGRAQFVPGFMQGGVDGGPVLDFGAIEGERVRRYWSENPRELESAMAAARIADEMARRFAEEERAYRAAESAGQRFAEVRDELRRLRRETLATIRAIKGECATLKALPAVIVNRLRESIRADLATRRHLVSQLDKLRAGEGKEWERFDASDSALVAIFNDAAGIAAA